MMRSYTLHEGKCVRGAKKCWEKGILSDDYLKRLPWKKNNTDHCCSCRSFRISIHVGFGDLLSLLSLSFELNVGTTIHPRVFCGRVNVKLKKIHASSAEVIDLKKQLC